MAYSKEVCQKALRLGRSLKSEWCVDEGSFTFTACLKILMIKNFDPQVASFTIR